MPPQEVCSQSQHQHEPTLYACFFILLQPLLKRSFRDIVCPAEITELNFGVSLELTNQELLFQWI